MVPTAGRQIVLQQLHDTHPGINRMKSLARSYVWWPGLDSDIQSTVQKCDVCQSNRGNPPKAPLHPWEWPSRPWSRLHIDHAGPFHGKLFLIVVDAYSKWIDVQIVPSTSAEGTILLPYSLFFLPLVCHSRWFQTMALVLLVLSFKSFSLKMGLNKF